VCCSLWYNAPTMLPDDVQNNWPKHVQLTGIINKPLLLHLVGCIYYLYHWCTVKKISNNEICLLIKHIKSVLWRVEKHLSYIEEARCLKVNLINVYKCVITVTRSFTSSNTSDLVEWVGIIRPWTANLSIHSRITQLCLETFFVGVSLNCVKSDGTIHLPHLK
jgi:hypothetical protein